MENNFFGSKLNTVLLLVLIVLMIIALKIMFQNKETYFSPFGQNQEQVKIDNKIPQITGNKDDLVSFSILPGQKVSGIMKINGSVKNGYFFEANIGIAVLDINQKNILQHYGMATTEWMTIDPVSFETTLDFSKLPKGPAYIQIQKDNPSDMREFDKFIFIPIVIE